MHGDISAYLLHPFISLISSYTPLIPLYNPLHLLQAHRAQLAHELAEEGFDVLVTSYSYFEGDSAAQVADPKYPLLGVIAKEHEARKARLHVTCTRRWPTVSYRVRGDC